MAFPLQGSAGVGLSLQSFLPPTLHQQKNASSNPNLTSTSPCRISHPHKPPAAKKDFRSIPNANPPHIPAPPQRLTPTACPPAHTPTARRPHPHKPTHKPARPLTFQEHKKRYSPKLGISSLVITFGFATASSHQAASACS
ncbi:MAG: hypothetical protein LBQ31_04360 [Bacteroidales bacterium]|nr:hypothetical protein [Bacteroidales bacterium]